MKVLIKPAALKSVKELILYITSEIKMPETGMRYGEKIIKFAEDLGQNWKAYKTCNYQPWAKQGLSCATFDKKYVFAFKAINNNVVIYYIKHGKLLH